MSEVARQSVSQYFFLFIIFAVIVTRGSDESSPTATSTAGSNLASTVDPGSLQSVVCCNLRIYIYITRRFVFVGDDDLCLYNRNSKSRFSLCFLEQAVVKCYQRLVDQESSPPLSSVILCAPCQPPPTNLLLFSSTVHDWTSKS